jgi:aldehyde:ferredoxin oxidoreductase
MLRLDLTNERVTVHNLDIGMLADYVGGKGLGAKILVEEVGFHKDAFEASTSLILTTGPVNGLAVSGAAKFCATFKSPLTGLWGESQCGGFFAPHMKKAGYDAIVISGRSERPVYFLVDDSTCQIKKADSLWGKDTFDTEDIIKKDEGNDFQVLSIGPAGENLVRYACISHDKGRELGRCGAGAIMGSKKLKAVAVRGTGVSKVSEPDKLKEFAQELNARAKERLTSLREYGTSNMISITNATGSLPTRYWTLGEFINVEKIGAEAIKRTILKQSKACFACIVACRKISRVETGLYAGTEVEGPEYETLYAFGPLCFNDDLGSIAKANELCDRLGMDTISAGNTVAFAMECFEKGLITTEKTGGIQLDFGNHEAIIALLPRIAYRDGLGAILAEGVERASKAIGKGAESFAVHVKGLEPPGYDPRALKGVALSYAVSCRGACHLRDMSYRPNLTGSNPFGGDKVDRLSYDGQAELVAEQENFYTLVDSMVLCKFLCLPSVGPIGWDEIVTLYNLVTGLEADKKDLVAKANRINNLVRYICTRMYMESKADSLPARFTEEPLNNGPSKGEKVHAARFDNMLKEYYALKGWTIGERTVTR